MRVPEAISVTSMQPKQILLLKPSSIILAIDQLSELLSLVTMIGIIDIIIDDVNAGFNDVKNVNSINDEYIVTNANNNYFCWLIDTIWPVLGGYFCG